MTRRLVRWFLSKFNERMLSEALWEKTSHRRQLYWAEARANARRCSTVREHYLVHDPKILSRRVLTWDSKVFGKTQPLETSDAA